MFDIRQSWTTSFTSVIKILRFGGKIIPTSTKSLRVLADLEVPHWTPTLPSGIKCVKSDTDLVDGEWIYPEEISNINNHSKYILYIHGGAFCMCKAGTHRGLLYRLAKKTNSIIFAVDYKRSPEYKYPIPLEDCLISYMYLLKKIKDPSKIIIAGDSAGGNLVINLVARLITNDFVYFVNKYEGDENAQVIMYNKKGELVSDNYFATSNMYEVLESEDEFEYIHPDLIEYKNEFN
jgi:acetyl esterase/lipase